MDDWESTKSFSKGITSYQPPMEREAEKDDKLLLL
jgi:hypothetical protein